MTNYEKIKQEVEAMSLGDMAVAINKRMYACSLTVACPCNCKTFPETCVEHIAKWLGSEADEERR